MEPISTDIRTFSGYAMRFLFRNPYFPVNQGGQIRIEGVFFPVHERKPVMLQETIDLVPSGLLGIYQVFTLQLGDGYLRSFTVRFQGSTARGCDFLKMNVDLMQDAAPILPLVMSYVQSGVDVAGYPNLPVRIMDTGVPVQFEETSGLPFALPANTPYVHSLPINTKLKIETVSVRFVADAAVGNRGIMILFQNSDTQVLASSHLTAAITAGQNVYINIGFASYPVIVTQTLTGVSFNGVACAQIRQGYCAFPILHGNFPASQDRIAVQSVGAFKSATDTMTEFLFTGNCWF